MNWKSSALALASAYFAIATYGGGGWTAAAASLACAVLAIATLKSKPYP